MWKTEKILKQLRSQGHRITKSRRGLISLIQRTRIPLSVEMFIPSLKKLGITVNKTTVYRELDFLKQNGLVQQIEFGDGKKRFERSGGVHHHHFVCQNCETVSDVPVNQLFEELERKLVKSNKFHIMDHSLEFFGLCRECQTTA